MKETAPCQVIRGVAGYSVKVPRWEVRTLINSLVFVEGEVMTIVTIGIDLAMNAFAAHGVDAAGKPALEHPWDIGV